MGAKDDSKQEKSNSSDTNIFLRNKKKSIAIAIVVVTISISIHYLLPHGCLNTPLFENSVEQKKTYVADDEPFLELVNETYRDEDLVKWSPAPVLTGNPDEPGYLGKPVVVPPELEEEAKKRFKENEFNVVASEMMSLNRTLLDNRFPECLALEYPKKLPTTSVIIVFYNEAWTTLLRTIWSVYTKSPKALLREIILVDDSSDREYLLEKLHQYVRTFPAKVTVVRTLKRSGLIQARIIGAKYARGQVITFLDAHCECNDGWLEPLLARVAQNRRVAVAPMIDVISDDDFRVEAAVIHEYGAFTWDFTFTWIPIPDRESDRLNGDRTLMIRSPAMAGGLYAIDKEYFNKIGAYDEGMKIWGAENLEMSLRLWMCGGMVEQAPCSRVGHVFRKNSPYLLPGGSNNVVFSNTARLVDVWTDEYKQIYYTITPGAVELRSNVTNRIELRKNLKCKSFSWYLKNVYPESALNVVAKKHGSIESLSEVGLCLDTMGHKKQNETVGVSGCHNLGGNQFFMLSENNEIRWDNMCLDASELMGAIKLYRCHGLEGNQKWIYDEKTKTFQQNDLNRCLALHKDSDPTLEECDGSLAQQWQLHERNVEID